MLLLLGAIQSNKKLFVTYDTKVMPYMIFATPSTAFLVFRGQNLMKVGRIGLHESIVNC